MFMKTYFKLVTKLNLLVGFLLINVKYSIKNSLIRTFIKGIISGLSTSPFYTTKSKLSGILETNFACSWQGNPSLTNIIRKKLAKI